MTRYDAPRSGIPQALPPNLFDEANMPQPVATRKIGTIEDNFREFHHHNPWVYEALVELAMDMHRHPGRPYGSGLSMGMLFEVLRWQYRRATTDEHSDFKLNNNYRSRYARLIMEQEPDLEGVFQIRELTTP